MCLFLAFSSKTQAQLDSFCYPPAYTSWAEWNATTAILICSEVCDVQLYEFKYRQKPNVWNQQNPPVWQYYQNTFPWAYADSLLTDSTYEFRVRVKCKNGYWSSYYPDEGNAPSQFVLAGNTCPDVNRVQTRPNQFYGDNLSHTEMSIHWDAINSTDVGTPVKYTLRYRLAKVTLPPNPWTYVYNIVQPGYSLSGLATESRYDYQVLANCDNYLWSQLKAFYTNTLCDDGPHMQEPGQDRSVAVAKNDLFVFPNPASELVNVVVSLENASAIQISLYDQLGRQIRTLQNGLSLPEGEQRFDFNISDLPQGHYVLRLISDDYSKALPFEKQ